MCEKTKILLNIFKFWENFMKKIWSEKNEDIAANEEANKQSRFSVPNPK